MPFDFQWIFLGVIPLGQTGFLFKWTSIWKIHRLQIMFSMGKPLESMRFSLSRWTNEHIWSYIYVCVCQDDEYGWTMIMPEWKVCMRFDSLKASFFLQKVLVSLRCPPSATWVSSDKIGCSKSSSDMMERTTPWVKWWQMSSAGGDVLNVVSVCLSLFLSYIILYTYSEINVYSFRMLVWTIIATEIHKLGINTLKIRSPGAAAA